jgi:hypothetical protein
MFNMSSIEVSKLEKTLVDHAQKALDEYNYARLERLLPLLSALRYAYSDYGLSQH